MTIRVLAMSDLHVEFDQFHFSLDETLDLLVLAGDIGPGSTGVWLAKTYFPGSFPKVVIAGNHEFYRAPYDETIEICRSSAAAADNVHFLEQDEQIFEINGCRVRVLGCILWTDFSVNGIERQHSSMMNAGTRMNDFRLISFSRTHPTARRHARTASSIESMVGRTPTGATRRSYDPRHASRSER